MEVPIWLAHLKVTVLAGGKDKGGAWPGLWQGKTELTVFDQFVPRHRPFLETLWCIVVSNAASLSTLIITSASQFHSDFKNKTKNDCRKGKISRWDTWWLETVRLTTHQDMNTFGYSGVYLVSSSSMAGIEPYRSLHSVS